MEVLHRRCAGLDVHKKTVVACVRLAEENKVVTEVRTFATTTAGLLALSAWLSENGCTHVAMGQADDGPKRGGLPNPVAAEHRDDAAGRDLQVHALQNMSVSVIGVQILNQQARCARHHSAPPR